MEKLKYIDNTFIEKVKNNKCSEISKMERELFKMQVLHDFKEIKGYIKKTLITKYGLYVYFVDNVYTRYIFISYLELRDIDNYYIEYIKDIISLVKESEEK